MIGNSLEKGNGSFKKRLSSNEMNNITRNL